jgi:fumarate reductase subunit D
MKRSHEPIFWSLFGAGGVLSALLAPILIFITGIITPIGVWMPPQALDYARVLGFAQHWIGKALLLAVISLFLFHAAHRIYHGLHDLGVHAGTGTMLPARRCADRHAGNSLPADGLRFLGKFRPGPGENNEHPGKPSTLQSSYLALAARWIAAAVSSGISSASSSPDVRQAPGGAIGLIGVTVVVLSPGFSSARSSWRSPASMMPAPR